MDNLRYISLQYIKGDNYEKIQCFKYEEMMELLNEVKEFRDYSQPIYDKFDDAIEEEKCPIGESFLNDLVNYYNFKDIKDALEDVKKDIVYAGYESNIGDNRTTLIKNLDELIKAIIKTNVDIDIGKQIKITNKTQKKYDAFRKLANEKYNLDFVELDFNANADDSPTNRGYNRLEEDFVEFIVKHEYNDIEELKTQIISMINYILNAREGTKDNLVMYLKILKTVLSFEDSLDAIMLLFNKYIKLCVRNMDKYERLFSKNDISNIDDIFMIKSYAMFLNKLEALKKSLESKDKTKLERGLANALERLFDLYGVNDSTSIINDENSYIYEHISNIYNNKL
jgi:SpoU rRNA methylase family enzyme